MNFREVGIEEIKRVQRKGNLFIFLEEFENAHIPAAEIEWQGHYKSSEVAVTVINNAIKRYHKTHLKTTRRGGQGLHHKCSCTH